MFDLCLSLIIHLSKTKSCFAENTICEELLVFGIPPNLLNIPFSLRNEIAREFGIAQPHEEEGKPS